MPAFFRPNCAVRRQRGHIRIQIEASHVDLNRRNEPFRDDAHAQVDAFTRVGPPVASNRIDDDPHPCAFSHEYQLVAAEERRRRLPVRDFVRTVPRGAAGSVLRVPFTRC